MWKENHNDEGTRNKVGGKEVIGESEARRVQRTTVLYSSINFIVSCSSLYTSRHRRPLAVCRKERIDKQS